MERTPDAYSQAHTEHEHNIQIIESNVTEKHLGAHWFEVSPGIPIQHPLWISHTTVGVTHQIPNKPTNPVCHSGDLLDEADTARCKSSEATTGNSVNKSWH